MFSLPDSTLIAPLTPTARALMRAEGRLEVAVEALREIASKGDETAREALEFLEHANR